jgi:hypothetical protein
MGLLSYSSVLHDMVPGKHGIVGVHRDGIFQYIDMVLLWKGLSWQLPQQREKASTGIRRRLLI